MASLDAPALYSLFSTGQYSDFTVICKGRKFQVHKMVICPTSRFFQAVAKGNFQEQDSVTLQDSDPDTIAKVLHYLYFASYHINDKACSLANHVNHKVDLMDEVFAEEWFLALQPATKSKMTSVIPQPRLIPHLDVYEAADMLGVENLKHAATCHILKAITNKASAETLAVFLELVYTRLPDTDTILRPALTHACTINYDRLDCHEDVMAVMEKHEPAVWNAAKFIAKVNASRMINLIEQIASTICHFRTCVCGETNTSNSSATTQAGIIKIDIECTKCDKFIGFESE